MGDSLQDYFSNLLGCGGGLSSISEIVPDNARSRPSFTGNIKNNSSNDVDNDDMNFDWLHNWCSVDTTRTPFSAAVAAGGCGGAPFCLNRWDSVPQQQEQQQRQRQDTVMKRPRRRPLGDGSDNPGEEGVAEDYRAIFLPTEDAMDGDDRVDQVPKTSFLPRRTTGIMSPQRSISPSSSNSSLDGTP